MKSLFVFNGCSCTAGKEIFRDRPQANDNETRRFAWTEHFTKLCNPNGKAVNLARSGSSNDSIFRTTIEWLGRNPDASETAFVAIMWTEPNRYEFELLNGFNHDVIAASTVHKSQEEKYLNKFVNEYMRNRELSNQRTLNMMLSLEAILTMRGIPFVFMNAFNFNHFYKGHLDKKFASYTLSNYKGKDLFLNDQLSMYQVLTDAKYDMTKAYHFHEDGHKYYAQYIYDKLGDLI